MHLQVQIFLGSPYLVTINGRVSTVLLEGASQRKLAESVPHHVFSHEDRIKNFSIVHIEGQPNELRGDHRAARPGLDRGLGVSSLRLHDFVHEVKIYKRTFFN